MESGLILWIIVNFYYLLLILQKTVKATRFLINQMEKISLNLKYKVKQTNENLQKYLHPASSLYTANYIYASA